MADKMDIKLKKCITPEARASFANVFKAKAIGDSDDEKYSITLLFPVNTDLKELKRACTNAAIEKWGPKEKWPKKLRLPFRDGNEKADQVGYENTIFVYASSKQKPEVVDRDRQPIINQEDFYSGCYCHASLIAFAYDTKGNVGVSFSLQSVLKSRDGKPFSGKKTAAQDFEGLTIAEDVASTAEDTDDMGSALGLD